MVNKLKKPKAKGTIIYVIMAFKTPLQEETDLAIKKLKIKDDKDKYDKTTLKQ